MREKVRHVGAMQRHAPHGGNDTDVGGTPLRQRPQPVLAQIGLGVFKRDHPLNSGLGGNLFHLDARVPGYRIGGRIGLTATSINKPQNPQTQLGLTVQGQGRIRRIRANADDDGGAHPQIKLFENHAGDSAHQNDHDQGNWP